MSPAVAERAGRVPAMGRSRWWRQGGCGLVGALLVGALLVGALLVGSGRGAGGAPWFTCWSVTVLVLFTAITVPLPRPGR